MSQIFDREIGTLNTYFTNNKKKKGSTKKYSHILKRLSQIHPEIKRRVLQLYMCRMKFQYTVKTLKWFLLYRAD